MAQSIFTQSTYLLESRRKKKIEPILWGFEETSRTFPSLLNSLSPLGWSGKESRVPNIPLMESDVPHNQILSKESFFLPTTSTNSLLNFTSRTRIISTLFLSHLYQTYQILQVFYLWCLLQTSQMGFGRGLCLNTSKQEKPIRLIREAIPILQEQVSWILELYLSDLEC